MGEERQLLAEDEIMQDEDAASEERSKEAKLEETWKQVHQMISDVKKMTAYNQKEKEKLDKIAAIQRRNASGVERELAMGVRFDCSAECNSDEEDATIWKIYRDGQTQLSRSAH